jgi:hypothetical protein
VSIQEVVVGGSLEVRGRLSRKEEAGKGEKIE